MKVAVVLNGDPPSPERLRRAAADAAVYAADGGAKACLAASVRPVRVVGDFDSQERSALPEDWECVVDADQNFTDFEKVLRRLPREMTSLTVLGGLGGRLDHTWSTLTAAAGLRDTLRVCFAGERETLWRVTPGCPLTVDLVPGALVSLLPVGAVSGVCSRGLRWALRDADLGPGAGLAQSNVADGPVEITLRSGALYVWSDRLM
ncbi:MAG: thiamine diphosphokinase [Verrucomicrobia bacterium]|nr:thiamine diphosphokinase [Verrucomicrobiota bacterium]MCH8528440.1 thiamine diphosphokinase [Kiritimatiellia bacterium]